MTLKNIVKHTNCDFVNVIPVIYRCLLPVQTQLFADFPLTAKCFFFHLGNNNNIRSYFSIFKSNGTHNHNTHTQSMKITFIVRKWTVNVSMIIRWTNCPVTCTTESHSSPNKRKSSAGAIETTVNQRHTKQQQQKRKQKVESVYSAILAERLDAHFRWFVVVVVLLLLVLFAYCFLFMTKFIIAQHRSAVRVCWML